MIEKTNLGRRRKTMFEIVLLLFVIFLCGVTGYCVSKFADLKQQIILQEEKNKLTTKYYTDLQAKYNSLEIKHKKLTDSTKKPTIPKPKAKAKNVVPE